MMDIKNMILLCCSMLLLSSCSSTAVTDSFSKFLAQNDLVWDQAPDNFYDGAFIGDGVQGAMIMQDDQNKNGLRMLMGHYQAIAHNVIKDIEYCNNRIFAGDIILTPAGKTASQTMRLSLWDGQVNGTIETDQGSIAWQAFAERTHRVFVVSLQGRKGEQDAVLGVREQWGITPRIYLDKINPQDHIDQLPPKPSHTQRGDIALILNPMKNRGAHVVASQSVTGPDNSRVLYVAVATDDSDDPGQAAEKAAVMAVKRVKAAVQEGFESISQRHRDWWHTYMQTSYLELPEDAYWQKFWWVQLYKFASASSETSDLVIDTQGPWIWDCGWGAIWWNLNIQLSYFPMYSANKLDVGRSLINGIDRFYRSGAFRQNAGSSPGIFVGRTTTYEGYGSWGDEFGNMPWVLHSYWRYWRYSADDAIGRALFPMLKDSADFLISKLEKDAEGTLHFVPSRSPEYHDQQLYKDTNYALMSLRWVLQTLLDMDKELEFNDPGRSRWQTTLESLADYPVDEHGLRIAAEQGFDETHRHYSHLLAIYPYHTLTPDQGPDARDLILRSLQRWQSLEGGHAGYTYTGGCAMYATLGDGDQALLTLDRLKRFIEYNTMYREGGGAVVETPLSAVESINYMLLQSWNGILRIFPAVPDRWKHVTFRNFRTQGAFLVSAERENGAIRSIRITSEKGKPCTVLNPWPGKDMVINDAAGKTVDAAIDGDHYTFATESGRDYHLSVAD